MITSRGMLQHFVLGIAVLAAPMLAISGFGEEAYHAFYSSFMPMTCCFTNACCYPIEPHEVVDLGGGRYRIVVSGQIVDRKGFSPDGRYHRCACDDVGGRWVVHPTANTRCLFVPNTGS